MQGKNPVRRKTLLFSLNMRRIISIFLIEKGILKKEESGGRSTNYELVDY